MCFVREATNNKTNNNPKKKELHRPNTQKIITEKNSEKINIYGKINDSSSSRYRMARYSRT